VGASFGHFLRYGPKEPAAAESLPVAPPRARKAAEDTVIGDHIVRHGLGSRVTHWAVALAFMVTLLTGLPIWTPIFGWMAGLFGGLHVCRWLHPWAGVALVVAAAAMFFRWLGEMRMEKGDWGWLGPKLIAYFRQEGEGEDVGKYNGGQKVFFFAVSALAVLLLLTGLVLWFPLSFAAGLREASWMIHDAAFLFFAVSIVVHIYLGTAALPGTFQSMTRGTVSKAWARLHHPRWYRQSTGAAPDGERR
jgi:formate dehydrogenase subunit gamma